MTTSPDHLEEEERAFVDNLYRFMKDRGSPIERIPHLGFKQINLWKIYKAVEALGGYDSVTARRMWKNVYDELGGSPGSTSAATCTRKHYERLILPFEKQLRGEEYKPLPPSKPRKLYKKSPDMKRSKAEGKTRRKTTAREEKTTLEVLDKHLVKETAHRGQPHCGFHQDQPQSHNKFGDHQTVAFMKLESHRDISLPVPSGPAGVISPLEKKKLLAQASLCVLQSPKAAENDSETPFVIHCSLSPGCPTQGDAQNSSDGSPLPPSSPSVTCSLSPSPDSVSSEESLAVTEPIISRSATDTKTRSQSNPPPIGLSATHSSQSSPSLHKPLSCYPTRLVSLHHRQGLFQARSNQLNTTLALDASKRYREIYALGSEKQGGTSQPPVLKQTKLTQPWMSSASSFTRVVPRYKDGHPLSGHPLYKALPLTYEPTYKVYTRHGQELRESPSKIQAFSPLHSIGKKDKGIHVWHSPLPSPQLIQHSAMGRQVPYLGPENHRGQHAVLPPTYLPMPHVNPHQPQLMPPGASLPIPYDCSLQSNPHTLPFGPPLTGLYLYSSNTRI
ncbi:hypothetical protein ACEWY4_012603 [Coilia grayii]|uniref:ARID domain-containing protein n=1 Tax=Coilia grayii TaxID=363190 RepID=A0ABD1K132_9TELE